VCVVKRLPSGVAVIAIVLAASACAGGHRANVKHGSSVSLYLYPSKIPVSAKTVSSSRLILGGRVRCTATFPTRVAAGQTIADTFSFRKVSSRAGFGWRSKAARSS
jgi:hypothetical protein